MECENFQHTPLRRVFLKGEFSHNEKYHFFTNTRELNKCTCHCLLFENGLNYLQKCFFSLFLTKLSYINNNNYNTIVKIEQNIILNKLESVKQMYMALLSF